VAHSVAHLVRDGPVEQAAEQVAVPVVADVNARTRRVGHERFSQGGRGFPAVAVVESRIGPDHDVHAFERRFASVLVGQSPINHLHHLAHAIRHVLRLVRVYAQDEADGLLVKE